MGRARSAARLRLAPGSPLIGYVTVRSEAGSAAAVGRGRDRGALRALRLNLLEIVNDRDRGRIRQRPGLRYALERIVEREADGLVISDLHLLSRSIVDLGALVAWFRDAHATLIALDLNIDTSTPEGDHVAGTLIALAASSTSGSPPGRARAGQGSREGPPMAARRSATGPS